MKNLVLLLIIGMFGLSSCKPKYHETINIANTQWISQVSDNYYDSIIFLDNNKYRFYSCETGETFYGKYRIDRNIIYLHQTRDSYDNEDTLTDSRRKTDVKFKLMLKDKKIYFIERWEKDIKGNWYKSKYKFPEDYNFKKIRKKRS